MVIHITNFLPKKNQHYTQNREKRHFASQPHFPGHGAVQSLANLCSADVPGNCLQFILV
jgi:hypothetical protein